jgi:hypothetical protein
MDSRKKNFVFIIFIAFCLYVCILILFKFKPTITHELHWIILNVFFARLQCISLRIYQNENISNKTSMENSNTCPVHVSLSLTVCAKMKQIKGTHQTPYACAHAHYFSIYGIQNRFSVLNNFKRSNAITSMQTRFWTGQKRIKWRTKCLCVRPSSLPRI